MTGLEEMDLGSSNTISGSKVVEDAVPGLEKDGKNAGNPWFWDRQNGKIMGESWDVRVECSLIWENYVLMDFVEFHEMQGDIEPWICGLSGDPLPEQSKKGLFGLLWMIPDGFFLEFPKFGGCIAAGGVSRRLEAVAGWLHHTNADMR